MDDLDLKRLKAIGRAARKAKQWLTNVRNDVERWNRNADEEHQLSPNLKTLSQAADALMDLNNACADRERRYQREQARKQT